jgi:hypothetical protein
MQGLVPVFFARGIRCVSDWAPRGYEAKFGGYSFWLDVDVLDVEEAAYPLGYAMRRATPIPPVAPARVIVSDSVSKSFTQKLKWTN